MYTAQRVCFGARMFLSFDVFFLLLSSSETRLLNPSQRQLENAHISMLLLSVFLILILH